MMVDASYVQLSDGRQIAYQEYGDREGCPVFFFHGWIGSRLDFGPNDDIARELGIRVIAVDRPGCGSSDFQQDRRLLDWPDDVSEMADALKLGQFAICGHSFGGPYVAACASQLPDRVTSAAIVAGISAVVRRRNSGDVGPGAFGPLVGWSRPGGRPTVRFNNGQDGQEAGQHCERDRFDASRR